MDDSADLDELGPKPDNPRPARVPKAKDAIEEKREDMRGRIALWLVGGFVVQMLLSIVAFAFIAFGSVDFERDPELKVTLALAQMRQAQLNSMLQLTLTPLFGLIGTMLGFYFSGRNQGSKA
jgi:hypothetical protein